MKGKTHIPVWRSVCISWVFILIAASIPASAAATGDETRQVTVTDDLGRDVTVHGHPRRIVSLSPANTELLFAIGLGNRTVAVAEQSDYPPEALDLPTVGGYTTISIEKVVGMEPDLVLASRGNSPGTIERLESFGIPVLALNAETVEGILHDIRLIGKAAGAEEAAEALCDRLTDRMNRVEAEVAAAEETPVVAHVIWYDPIWVSGGNTLQDEVIRLAGGENAFSHLDGWQTVSLEEFVTSDPDCILVNSGTGMSGAEYSLIYDYIRGEPRFADLSAVKNNRVFIVDADTISRPGPRIVDAIEEVAAAIHPGLYATPATTAPPAARSPLWVGLCLPAVVCAALLSYLVRR